MGNILYYIMTDTDKFEYEYKSINIKLKNSKSKVERDLLLKRKKELSDLRHILYKEEIESYKVLWFDIIEHIYDEELMNELVEFNINNWEENKFYIYFTEKNKSLYYKLVNYFWENYDLQITKPHTYNYQKIKEKNKDINREVCEYYWHPNRMDLWLWQEEDE